MREYMSVHIQGQKQNCPTGMYYITKLTAKKQTHSFSLIPQLSPPSSINTKKQWTEILAKSKIHCYVYQQGQKEKKIPVLNTYT